MKKRNLFLSLACSIILIIALATFTIISVVKKDKPNNDQSANNVSMNVSDSMKNINEKRDGSKDLPYVLYDVESFNYYVGKYGYVAEADEVCYFELARDIDFAGVNFVTLFNQDNPFNGKINGKGFDLRNININVTKNNIESFIRRVKIAENRYRYDARVAIFGSMQNAEIVDLGISNISVSIADDVYPYIYDGGFAKKFGDAMNEITVSILAATSKNSVIDKVDVNGQIKADAYSIYTTNKVQGNNAIGGVVAIANNCQIENTSVDVNLTTAPSSEEETKNYFVGGIAGYAYNSTIENVDVDFAVSANYKQVIYLGGIAGYSTNTDIAFAKVKLDVKENSSRKEIVSGETINVENYSWIAGAVAIIEADKAAFSTNLNDVVINANVDIDAVYAGVVVDVWSSATSGECVTFTDVIVNSNVNTLHAYGFARYIENKDVVKFDLQKVDAVGQFNVKLTGNIRLTGSISNIVASASIFKVNYKSFKVVVSSRIYNKLPANERNVAFGSFDII